MNKKSHSGVFMMEMIAVVFFFILCAGICIQTFAKADLMSRGAADLNRAVFIAQSTGEVFKTEGIKGLEEEFAVYGQIESTEGYRLGFDKNGNPSEENLAVFVVKAEFPIKGKMILSVEKGQKELYTLTVDRHVRAD